MADRDHRVIVKRTENEDLAPLTWWAVDSGGGKTAMFVCPQKHLGSLRGHTILADGTVEPSVRCVRTVEGTDEHFHEYLKLEDWNV